MLHNFYLYEALILLLAAVLVVSLFRYIKASPVLGYLMAGVLIGPYSFGLITEVEHIKVLGELGVVFLLFTLGLKVPLQRLTVLRRYVFGLGFSQVTLTSLAIAGACYMMGQTPEASILIGSALALSSTAVVMRVLSDNNEFALRHGRVSFSVLLFQDLAVVVLLVLQSTIGDESTSLGYEFALAGVKAFVALIAIVLIGRVILRPLYRGIAHLGYPELFIPVTLLVVLTTAVLTAQFGLSMELGAFLAGLLLSETEYRHQVEADINPFYGLLMGTFFMSVGMSINLDLLQQNFVFILQSLILLLAIKTFILHFLCRLFGIPRPSSLRVALLLSTGGEFLFILIGPAITSGLVSDHLGQLLYSTVAISMAFTPLLALLGKFITDRWMEQEAEASTKTTIEEIGDLKNHVIVCGYGRVGKLVASLLTKRLVPFVAIDNDMARVSEGRANGLPIFYGDARRMHMMRTLGADKACAAVISLDKPKGAVDTAMMFRRQFPHIDVSVRMRDNRYEELLEKAGVHVVMPENLEPSLQLAARVLSDIGTPQDEVSQVIEDFRKSVSLRNTERADASSSAQIKE